MRYLAESHVNTGWNAYAALPRKGLPIDVIGKIYFGELKITTYRHNEAQRLRHERETAYERTTQNGIVEAMHTHASDRRLTETGSAKFFVKSDSLTP